MEMGCPPSSVYKPKRNGQVLSLLTRSSIHFQHQSRIQCFTS
ncbi:hypothetical protein NMG60_11002852 [Bertholletia excelsa]